MEKRGFKTLVLVCRRDFCRLIDRVLRGEGLSDIQHGGLELIDDATNKADTTEVFVIPADADRAERLIRLLRACPFRGGAEKNFEVYTIG